MLSHSDQNPEAFIPPVPWPGKFKGVTYAPSLDGKLLEDFFGALTGEIRFRVLLIERKQQLLEDYGIAMEPFLRAELAQAVLDQMEFGLEEGESLEVEGSRAPWHNPYWSDQLPLAGDRILAEMIDTVLDRFSDARQLSFTELTAMMKECAPSLNLLSLSRVIQTQSPGGEDTAEYVGDEGGEMFSFSNTRDALTAAQELLMQQFFEPVFSAWQQSSTLNPRRSHEKDRLNAQIWTEYHELRFEDLPELYDFCAEQFLMSWRQFEIGIGDRESGGEFLLRQLESCWDQLLAVAAVTEGLVFDLDILRDVEAPGGAVNFAGRSAEFLSPDQVQTLTSGTLSAMQALAESCSFSFNWNADLFRRIINRTI